jgi:hypothetical protein
MDVTLKRIDYLPEGIFGEIRDAAGDLIAVTLEHAYDDQVGGWTTKVAGGIYTCVRHAPNRLPYETFMLENVPPFQTHPVTGILIHIGNFNKDSDGCILIGTNLSMIGGVQAIANSKAAFDQFMQMQDGLSSFRLSIFD